ncbi:MAG: hypothetical protein JWR37_1280 [Mycobacterium sp.]|nr:hypothetical protein [Mycobacterium sp.]
MNRIAAMVAIVAGAVFVVAGIFGAGVIAGAHSAGDRGGFERANHESTNFASQRGSAPVGQIWVFPGGGAASPDGYDSPGQLGQSTVLTIRGS